MDCLGNTGGNSTGAVDAWLAKLDVDKGRLQKFNGDSTDLVSVSSPIAISTTDVTNRIVTADKLPAGDNIINPGGNGSITYGQIVSKLTNVFAPDVQNSFSSVFSQGVANNNAPFLSPSDLQLLRR